MGKIALGTVQFGLDYGINNKGGKVPEKQVVELLKLAKSGGVEVLDTAAAYGSSEEVLGSCLNTSQLSFNIVSKLPPRTPPKEVKNAFTQSLKKLGQKSLHGYLVHHFSDFKNNPDIWKEMLDLKNEGKIEKIGLSLYHPDEADYLWDNDIDFKIVQVPYSIFDQRFSSVFPRMKARGVEIHVRSIFLQGLFFRKPEHLPQHFHSVKDKVSLLHDISLKSGLSIADLCLGFGLTNQFIDQVVIGVDQKEMLIENLNVLQKKSKISGLSTRLKSLKEEDEKIILPTHWVLD